MSTVRRFRKKPVVVEACLFDPGIDYDAACEVVRWCGGRAVGEGCEIDTLEGVMLATPGDWIIREPFPTSDRQFYPCKPDIFAATYEAVDD